MLQQIPGTLPAKNQRTLFIFLAVMSVSCFGLTILRWYITGRPQFLFLNWNLFLAAVPWALSTMILSSPMLQKRGIFTFFLVVTWLLFFPNSPYILTDLFHLKSFSTVPKWYDLFMILSFAWTGLVFGFLSLRDMETLLKKRFSSRTVMFSIVIMLFIIAFGVYLGRYQRWNSWDVISNPNGLIAEIADRFANPLNHPRTWGVTMMLGLLLNFMFFSFRMMGRVKFAQNH